MKETTYRINGASENAFCYNIPDLQRFLDRPFSCVTHFLSWIIGPLHNMGVLSRRCAEPCVHSALMSVVFTMFRYTPVIVNESLSTSRHRTRRVTDLLRSRLVVCKRPRLFVNNAFTLSESNTPFTRYNWLHLKGDTKYQKNKVV